MYFITTKRMLEVCFSAHPNIQYRTDFNTCTPAFVLVSGMAVNGLGQDIG
ncbi:MAG: hypothetical protein ACLTL7_18255 [Enterocloster bolteae]|nr:hypothetical protein [Enterocloster bolteae]MDU1140409.1 hypothetical protein [Enterocloster bolteae]